MVLVYVQSGAGAKSECVVVAGPSVMDEPLEFPVKVAEFVTFCPAENGGFG